MIEVALSLVWIALGAVGSALLLRANQRRGRRRFTALEVHPGRVYLAGAVLGPAALPLQLLVRRLWERWDRQAAAAAELEKAARRDAWEREKGLYAPGGGTGVSEEGGDGEPRSALVTGATGFTGSRLCRHLHARGWTVRALVRPGSDRSRLGDLPVEIVRGDLAADEPLDRATEGMDVVFHVAALFRAEDVPRDRFWAVNAEGTRRVLAAAARTGVARVVHCSTVGVHGHVADPPATEEAPFAPGDHYQASKLEGERIARGFADEGLPVTVVRPAGIYGPGDLRFLKLFRLARLCRWVMIGSGEVCYHFTYVDDVVRGLVAAAAAEEAAGEVVIVAGEAPVTLEALVDLVRRILGEPVPGRRLHLPVRPLRWAAVACEAACRPLGLQPPLFRRRVDFFEKNRAFDASRAAELLGVEPEVGLEEGLRRTAAWYRSEGLI